MAKYVKWTNDMRSYMYNRLFVKYGEYDHTMFNTIMNDKDIFKEIADVLLMEYDVEFKPTAVRQQFSWAVTKQTKIKGRFMRPWVVNKAMAIDAGFITLEYIKNDNPLSINIMEDIDSDVPLEEETAEIEDVIDFGQFIPTALGDDGILYEGDAYTMIKGLPDNSIDLVMIDPPYILDNGVGAGRYGGGNQVYHNDIDDKSKTLKEGFDFSIFDEYNRVCKLFNAYIFCNVKLLSKLMVYFYSHKDHFNIDVLMLNKTNPIPTCNNKYLSDTEYILYVRKKGAKLYGDYFSKRKSYDHKVTRREHDHPTIKPLGLVEKLILNSTKEGDMVLDNYMWWNKDANICEDIIIKRVDKYNENVILKNKAIFSEKNINDNLKKLFSDVKRFFVQEDDNDANERFKKERNAIRDECESKYELETTNYLSLSWLERWGKDKPHMNLSPSVEYNRDKNNQTKKFQDEYIDKRFLEYKEKYALKLMKTLEDLDYKIDLTYFYHFFNQWKTIS